MNKIFIFSILFALCIPLFACSEATPHNDDLESDSYSVETTCPPDSRTIASDVFLAKVVKGMTEEEVISAVGEAQGQATVNTPLREGTSVTFPLPHSVYETSDSKKIYIAYLADGTDIPTVYSIIVR